MREIKFRAWSKRKNKMLPVKGLSFDYCREIGYKNEEIGVVIGKPYVDEMSIDKSNWNTLEVANHGSEESMYSTVIIMQFTGLKNKNGKEIYEGDILTDGSLVDDSGNETWFNIGFDNGAFRIINTNCTCGCIGEVVEGAMESIIIGNIYENPELLK